MILNMNVKAEGIALAQKQKKETFRKTTCTNYKSIYLRQYQDGKLERLRRVRGDEKISISGLFLQTGKNMKHKKRTTRTDKNMDIVERQ
ncbi:hypothetical protein CW304_11720 [Bacillus sp. UFRGS-B20]|nr:hypothetical protein CW304_11720 [Bacillus sp. UFRGS-B20]